MKFKMMVSAGVVLATLAIPVVAGASNTLSQYNAMYATYKQIDAGLKNPTSTNASIEALFVRYSNEAVAFAGDDKTRSSIINKDIEAYSLAANKWAWVGYQTLASNTSNMEPWKSAVNGLSSITVKFTNDLKKASS